MSSAGALLQRRRFVAKRGWSCCEWCRLGRRVWVGVWVCVVLSCVVVSIVLWVRVVVVRVVIVVVGVVAAFDVAAIPLALHRLHGEDTRGRLEAYDML